MFQRCADFTFSLFLLFLSVAGLLLRSFAASLVSAPARARKKDQGLPFSRGPRTHSPHCAGYVDTGHAIRKYEELLDETCSATGSLHLKAN